MNWPYLHLVTNHFPVILTIVGAVVALLAALLRRRGLWMYAVVTLTLAGLSVYPAFLIGKEAEEMVEREPGIARASVEEHEEASEVALFTLLAVGAVSAFAWWRATRGGGREELPAWLRALVVVAALAGSGTVTYSALMGGKVVHGNNTITSRPSLMVSPRDTTAPARP
jgi:hypothetical protein